LYPAKLLALVSFSLAIQATNYDEKVWALNDSVGVSVVVISTLDDDVAAINALLRDAGHAVACQKISSLEELQDSLENSAPELIALFQSDSGSNLTSIAKIRDNASPKTPIIVVQDEVDETVIATAMRDGARDVVSLQNPERLKAVAGRELRACQLENALTNVMSSANQYKQELSSLKQITVEAIADIQEGIIVNANPAWLELFGFESDADLEGHPIMDLCIAADRPALKGCLVACEHQKWRDEKLKVQGQRDGGGDFSVEFKLERIDHEGETAVRLLVLPHNHANPDSTPEVLVEQAINRDPVTGFFNRQQTLESVSERLKTPLSGGIRAIACIRPDKFSKALNDVGVVGTEKIIRQLARILREVIQPEDVYGRFGGTIFTVLLERGNMNDVEAWAQLVLKNIASTVFDHENHSTVVTCSLGLCEVNEAGTDAAKILFESEQACRIARKKGGNKLELSESSGEAKKIRQVDTVWGPRIRNALTENRMRLEHQPIGSLNHDIEGAVDTLVRMIDEDGNTVLPSEFMPAAERTGLTKSIDRWVVGASFSFCRANDVGTVFVRLSRESMLDESLCDWLVTLANQTKVNPKQICFEISEDVVIRHLRQATDLANNLAKLGFRFAVEHFGASEDSSHLINIIPMRYLKIDGSLMQGLHKDPALQNKIKQLVAESRQKHIYTIAERVQDANTMAVLWQLGISYIQGNYVQNREIVIESMGTQTLKVKLMESVE